MNLVIKHQIYEKDHWRKFCHRLISSIGLIFSIRNDVITSYLWRQDALLGYVRRLCIEMSLPVMDAEAYLVQLEENGLIRRGFNGHYVFDGFRPIKK